MPIADRVRHLLEKTYTLCRQDPGVRMLLYRLLEAIADQLSFASDTFEAAVASLLEDLRSMQRPGGRFPTKAYKGRSATQAIADLQSELMRMQAVVQPLPRAIRQIRSLVCHQEDAVSLRFDDLEEHMMAESDRLRRITAASAELEKERQAAIDARTNHALTVIAVVTVALAPTEALSEIMQAWPLEYEGMPTVDWLHGVIVFCCLSVASWGAIFVYFRRVGAL